MPRLSHTQMRRFTALVRVEGAEKVIELSDEVKNKLLNEGYADDKGQGNFILSEKGQNEIERLSNIMGLTNRNTEEHD